MYNRCQHRASKQSARKAGHGKSALPGVPNISKHAADDDHGRRSSETLQEAKNNDRLDILGHGNWNLEDGEKEKAGED